jgi:hypothetical protein
VMLMLSKRLHGIMQHMKIAVILVGQFVLVLGCKIQSSNL